MARSLARAKGRLGGEGEQFAYIPRSVLESEAGRTLPHAALRVLAILLVGRPKERNGTMACSDTYAESFGLSSRDTVRRSLKTLQQRGLIVCTRRVQPFKKWPNLFAVTFWPIYFRDGERLKVPEQATHAYLRWRKHSPAHEGVGVVAQHSHRLPSTHAPANGVGMRCAHTDDDAERALLHTDGRRES